MERTVPHGIQSTRLRFWAVGLQQMVALVDRSPLTEETNLRKSEKGAAPESQGERWAEGRGGEEQRTESAGRRESPSCLATRFCKSASSRGLFLPFSRHHSCRCFRSGKLKSSCWLRQSSSPAGLVRVGDLTDWVSRLSAVLASLLRNMFVCASL